MSLGWGPVCVCVFVCVCGIGCQCMPRQRHVCLCVSAQTHNSHMHIQGALLALISIELLLQAPTEAFVAPASLYPARLQALSQFRARGLPFSGAQRGPAGRMLGLSMSEPQSSRVSPCVCVCVLCVCMCLMYLMCLLCVCVYVCVCVCV